MNQPNIEDRILALLDGDLSPEEAADLEKAIREDPTQLETYARLVALHSALETRFDNRQELGRGNLIPVNRLMDRQRKQSLKRSLYAAAAVLVALAVAMALILAPTTPPVVATFRTTAEASYLVTFEGEDEPLGEGLLAVGSRLRVSEGAFEGTFGSGVRFVAEAPCDLRILAEDRVLVDQGAAWFRVPAEATGFVAETPALVVVDLGTEFGVISRNGKPDEVHVIAGAVEVTARADHGETATLEAGMARQVEVDGRLTRIEPDPTHFRKRLDCIARFTFTGPPWDAPTESDFAVFASKTPSVDTDRHSRASLLANRGFTAGGYESYYIRDSDIGTAIFSGSATPGVGMNLGGANQQVPTHFLSFTVNPASGYQTTYESLSFYTSTHAPNEDYSLELRTWNGTTEKTLGSTSHTTGSADNGPVVMKTIDFMNFTSRDSIEFRLYVYGVRGPAEGPGASGVRLDDIVLNGWSERMTPTSGPQR